MFTLVVVTIIKKVEIISCVLTDESGISIQEYHPPMKKDQELIYDRPWMNLENRLL